MRPAQRYAAFYAAKEMRERGWHRIPSRAKRDVVAALIGLLLGAIVSAALLLTGFLFIPWWYAPSVCGHVRCYVVGESVVLPNYDRIDIELTGPAPGISYDPAGSPSNYLQR